MTAAWMLYVLLVGTLLAFAALAADVALRHTGTPARWIWVVALAGIVMLAVVAPMDQLVGATLVVPSAKVNDVGGTALAATSRSVMTLAAAAAHFVEASVARGIAAAASSIPRQLALALAVAWGALSAGIFALHVIVNRRLDRARCAWPVAHIHGTSVRVAPAIGPAVLGFRHPEIVVPRWLLARTQEEQRLVVVHEREHVVARDQIVLTGAWCAVGLLPWHPAVWWMLARLRLAIELDCDARVLRRGVDTKPYGTLLIDIAGQCGGLRLGALALADTMTHLERRLLAMKPKRTRFAALRIGVLGSLVAFSVMVACEVRIPTSAEIAKMDASSAERNAVASNLLSAKSKPLYLVDGVEVSAEKAGVIPAERIATINVSKPINGERGQISIVTVGAKLEQVKTKGATFDDVGANEALVSNTDRRTGETLFLKTRSPTGSDAKAVMGRNTSGRAKVAFGGSPFVFIDGVKSNESEMRKLNPADIASIDVLKGPAAVREVNDASAAENGVIRVVTKKSGAP